jgi:hypothetical protein
MNEWLKKREEKDMAHFREKLFNALDTSKMAEIMKSYLHMKMMEDAMITYRLTRC